jgi:hypothetical protein
MSWHSDEDQTPQVLSHCSVADLIKASRVNKQWEAICWNCARERARQLGHDSRLPIKKVMENLSVDELTKGWARMLPPVVHWDMIERHAIMLNATVYVVQVPLGLRNREFRPEQAISVYRVRGNVLICHLQADATSFWINFCLQGNVLAASSGPVVQLWNVEDGTRLHTILPVTLFGAQVVSLAMHHDWLAFSTVENSTELWSVKTQQRLKKWEHVMVAHPNQIIRSVAIAMVKADETADAHTLDNVRIVIGGEHAPTRIFRVDNNYPVFTLQFSDNHPQNLPAYVVKVYDDTVVTGSLRGWVYTWSLSTGQHTRSIKSDTECRVADISLYKNILCCAHSNGSVAGGVSVWLLSQQKRQNTYDSLPAMYWSTQTQNGQVGITKWGEVVFFNGFNTVMFCTPAKS